MTGFDKDWLALREPFDQAARSAELATDFAAALGATVEPKIVDLGGGTAANFRVLAPLIGRDQHWRLLDFDPLLLDHALDAVSHWAHAQGWEALRTDAWTLIVQADAGRWSLSVEHFDLATSLETFPFESFDAVVTTAFLDLVSQDWISRFTGRLASARRPVLATLTVDGRRVWCPAHPDDEWIESAFRLHQEGDKGFGVSLGVNATPALAQSLIQMGFEVRERASDWRIEGGPGRALLAQLLDDTARVALEVHPEEVTRIGAWYRLRREQIERGELRYIVGHRDLLALP
jgi:hypothetical protein